MGYQGTGQPLDGTHAHVQVFHQLGKGISAVGFPDAFQDTESLDDGIDHGGAGHKLSHRDNYYLISVIRLSPDFDLVKKNLSVRRVFETGH